MQKYVLLILLLVLFGCTQNADIKDTGPNPVNMANIEPANMTDITEDDNTMPDIENIGLNITMNDSELDSEIEALGDNRQDIYFFYSTQCFASHAIMPKIDELDARYNKTVNMVRYNILSQKGFDRYNEFAIEHNLSQKDRVVPLIYADGIKLVGMFQINESLGTILENLSRE